VDGGGRRRGCGCVGGTEGMTFNCQLSRDPSAEKTLPRRDDSATFLAAAKELQMKIVASRTSLVQFALSPALAVLATMSLPMMARAQAMSDQIKAMDQPVPPFHMIANIYYVDASDVTSYLIVTPTGDILLDGGFADTAAQIEKNIGMLGFKLTEVKMLLNSHAHLDHAGGLAELKAKTGAQLVLIEGDAEVIATGGKGAVSRGESRPRHPRWPHGLARRREDDLTSHGGAHARLPNLGDGVQDGRKSYNVVWVGSATVLPIYGLINRPGKPATYPGIQADYERTVAVLKALPCGVFFGSAHGSFYSLTAKRAALAKNPTQNPFIDPDGYRAYVARAEAMYQTELQRERSEQTN
jgi:metallo-beta-lactamase class B